MLRELVSERAWLIAVLLLFISLSACVDDERIQFYKQKCLSLTTYDAANIPECKTQERCFKLVQEKLFDFPQEKLPFESKRMLYHYQNHLAKSWFYYNITVEESKELRELCLQERFDDVIGKTNDLRYNIERAFEEADNAINTSFLFILYEKNNLEVQDINLVKEEPLYAFYIKLSDNERQIEAEELLPLDSYASHTRAIAEKIKNRKLFRDADVRIIKKQTLSEALLSFISSGLLNISKLPATSTAVFVPVFSEALAYFADFVEEAETLDRALDYLEEMPPNEFLSLLADAVAERNSLASEFAELAKEDSLHRAFLEDELNSLENELSKKLDRIDALSEFFQQDSFQYADTNFLAKLQALLNEPLSTSSESLYFSSLADAHIRAKPESIFLRLELQKIRQEYASSKITIGLRAQRLKELNLKADKVLSSLNVLKENFYSLLDKCSRKAQNIKLSEFSPEEAFELMQLKENFLNAHDSSKLIYCAELVGKEALAKEKVLLKKENEATLLSNSCYTELKALIPFVKDDRLIEHYNSMLDLNSGLQSYCNNLLAQVQKHLRGEYGIAEIEKKFGEIKMLRGFVEDYVEDTKFYSLSAFFMGGSLILKKALPEINSLRYEINKLYSETKSAVKEFLAAYVSEHYSLTSLLNSPVELRYDKPKGSIASNYLLSFENPFFEITEQLNIKLPLRFHSCTIINKTFNVDTLQCTNSNILISLNSLPKGKTFVEFSSSQEIALKKKSSSVMLSSDIAKITEEYTIASQASIPRLKVLLQDLNGNATIIFRNKGIPAIRQNGYLVAFLNEIEPNEGFEVSYAVLRPIEISLELIDEKRDLNKAFLHYICTIKNNIPYNARNVAIFLPLSTKNVESAKTHDEFGKRVALDLSGTRIKATVKELGAYESKSFYLQLVVSDYSAFKKRIIEDTRTVLQELRDSKELSREADKLLAELEQLGLEAGLDTLQKTYEKALQLRAKEAANRALSERYNFLKEALTNRVAELKGAALQARQLGLDELYSLFQERCDSAEEALAKAENLFKTNKEEALAIIEDSLESLSNIQANKTATLLKELAEHLMEQTNTLANHISKTGLADANTASYLKSAMQSYEDACRLISEAKLLEAKDSITALQYSLTDLNSYFEKSLEKRIASIASALDFVEIFRNNFASRLSSLEEQLASITKSQLVEARYLPEFDQRLLSEFAEQAEIANDSLWNRLKALIEEGSFIEAAEFASANYFDEKLSKLKSLDVRLKRIEDKLKEEAQYYLQLLEKSPNSNMLENLKKQASDELLKGNYLKAILISKAGLASLPETEDSSALYIGIFILLLLLIPLLLKLKKNKEKKVVFRRVLRNPDSL